MNCVEESPSPTCITQLSDNNLDGDISMSDARKKMEEKIFLALSKGSLAPISKAFENSPTLQAALKAWEAKRKKDLSTLLSPKREQTSIESQK